MSSGSDKPFEPRVDRTGEISAYVAVGTEDWVADQLAEQFPGNGGFTLTRGADPKFSIPSKSPYVEVFEKVMHEIKTEKRRPLLRLYHRTTSSSAESILAGGFRDRVGAYGTDVELCGVFLSDRPLDANEGATGDVLLIVEISLTRAEQEDCELVEEGKSYREFIVPADSLNNRASARVTDDE